MRSERVVSFLVVAVCAYAPLAAVAGPLVMYVDLAATGANDGSSWADAYVFLQDALTAASAAPKPIEIRVAQGVYKPDQGAGVTPGDEDATFQLLNGVTLAGGYAGASDPDVRDIERYPSVLSGALAGNGNAAGVSGYCLYVVTGRNLDATAVMYGFTITNEGGDGMLVEAAGPVVRNCTFVANRDAGVYAWHSDLVLENCLFERNGIGSSSWSALQCETGSLIVRDCRFKANEAGTVDGSGTFNLSRCVFVANNAQSWHGVVYCVGDVTATGCSFRSNTVADAIVLGVRGSAELVDCEFIDNSSTMGSMVNINGDSATLSGCSFTGNAGLLEGAVYSDCDVTRLSGCVFAGNACRAEGASAGAGAVCASGVLTSLSNCLFTGNSGNDNRPGAIYCNGLALRVSNCTFVDNRGQPGTLLFLPHGSSTHQEPDPSAELTQCIIWSDSQPFDQLPHREPAISLTYSDVQGGYGGEGNIATDPCFVRPGYWADPRDSSIGVGPDDPNALWVTGDYHLKSQAGHWDVETESWILDNVTSPCIDAGDPNGFLGEERFPNGGYVNMGAYGGTLEASRSYFGGPVCENQLAGDINGDCVVDQADVDILLSHWLMESTVVPNSPPTVTVASPEDGAEIFRPAALILRAEANDTDGTVVEVRYFVEYRQDSSMWGMELGGRDAASNWEAKFSTWSNVPFDGTYTVWAQAMDNEGAKSVSAPITIILHP